MKLKLYPTNYRASGLPFSPEQIYKVEDNFGSYVYACNKHHAIELMAERGLGEQFADERKRLVLERFETIFARPNWTENHTFAQIMHQTSFLGFCAISRRGADARHLAKLMLNDLGVLHSMMHFNIVFKAKQFPNDHDDHNTIIHISEIRKKEWLPMLNQLEDATIGFWDCDREFITR